MIGNVPLMSQRKEGEVVFGRIFFRRIYCVKQCIFGVGGTVGNVLKVFWETKVAESSKEHSLRNYTIVMLWQITRRRFLCELVWRGICVCFGTRRCTCGRYYALKQVPIQVCCQLSCISRTDSDTCTLRCHRHWYVYRKY